MANDSLIARYMYARAKAEERGDMGLVREIDRNLEWYRNGAPRDLVEGRLEEQVRPAGRPSVRRDS